MPTTSDASNIQPLSIGIEQVMNVICETRGDAKMVIEETILDNPTVFTRGFRFSVAELRNNLMHRYDVNRLRAHFRHLPEGDVTYMVGKALEKALHECSLTRYLSGDGMNSIFEIARVPRESHTFEGLQHEVNQLRQSMRNFKDLAAVVIDLVGAASALEATCGEQERIVHRLAMLALYYREKIITRRSNQLLTEDPTYANRITDLRIESSKWVDPDMTLIEEMVVNPDSHLQVTDIASIHGLLTNFVVASRGARLSHD